MKTALITGASLGIGAAFAKALAKRKYNLILVARSQEKLEQLAQQLERDHQITTEVITQDLTIANASQTVFDTVTAKGLQVDLLVNNAGFGDYGLFAETALDKQLQMIQLNIAALTALTHLFLTPMRDRKEGGIINIASVAGFQPIPYMSIYAATKAFVLSFSEALWAENQDAGITVSCICPGPTETEFFKTANFPTRSDTESGKSNNASPEDVVETALEGFEKKQATVITGGVFNQVIATLPRLLPRETLVSAIGKQFRPK
ncbi:UNVERIFIED_CONTAM: oxidoreductase [Euhalothece sp. KZN 001]